MKLIEKAGYIVLCLLLQFAITNCSSGNDDSSEEPYITVSPENISFASVGGEQILNVATNATNWNAVSNQNWCKVSTNDFTKLIVSVDANLTSVSRDATITVTSGSGASYVVNVTQEQYTTAPQPTYEGIDYELDDSTIIYSGQQANSCITSCDTLSHKLVYQAGLPAELLPQVGDKIVVAGVSELFPMGLLARITSITENGGSITASYELIEIQEAFKELVVDSTEVDLNGSVLRIEDEMGNPIQFAQSRAVGESGSGSITLSLPAVQISASNYLKFTPQFDITLGMDFYLNIWDYSIKNARLRFNHAIKMGTSLEASYATQDSQFGKECLLYTLYMAPIPVGPVVLVPLIKLYAIVGVTGKVYITTSVSYSQAYSTGVYYGNGSWWMMNENKSPENSGFNVSGSVGVEGGFYVGLKASYGMGFYGEVLDLGLGVATKAQAIGKIDLDVDGIGKGVYDTFKNSSLREEIAVSAEGDIHALRSKVAHITAAEKSFPIFELFAAPTIEKVTVTPVEGEEGTVDISLMAKNMTLFDVGIDGIITDEDGALIDRVTFTESHSPADNEQAVTYTVTVSQLINETYTLTPVIVYGEDSELSVDSKSVEFNPDLAIPYFNGCGVSLRMDCRMLTIDVDGEEYYSDTYFALYCGVDYGENCGETIEKEDGMMEYVLSKTENYSGIIYHHNIRLLIDPLTKEIVEGTVSYSDSYNDNVTRGSFELKNIPRTEGTEKIWYYQLNDLDSNTFPNYIANLSYSTSYSSYVSGYSCDLSIYLYSNVFDE